MKCKLLVGKDVDIFYFMKIVMLQVFPHIPDSDGVML